MTKIWWEPYRAGIGNPMLSEVGTPPALERYFQAPTLARSRVLFVRVAGFTFTFHSPEQLRACLDFYARKLHPTSRSAERADAVRSGEVCGRFEVERWYERLPLYLREEPKRLRVVAALEAAVRRAVAEGFEA